MQFKKAVEDYKKDHPFPMLMRRRRGGDRERQLGHVKFIEKEGGEIVETS
ncbi:hypothetical protein HPP92_017266 [Vanilla planifolia]|uniref:Uncharacterized protein n=1 Tax=Vanilla planifolia TaxID=51239 RepID=A0A835QGQ5_VANPL|nr:hypothetical protein HPP92_017266 [Vanilla planifolia]